MSQPVRIPADVDREDTVAANLTARQLLLLAAAGAVLYLLWTLTRSLLPAPVFLLAAVPLAAVSAYIALGHRDGLPMDRLLLAALRQRLSPRYRVTAPEGTHPAPAWLTPRTNQQQETFSPAPLRLPAERVRETGVVELGTDGLAAIAVCGTVNFALRTLTEQEALVASFARYLHSLTAPVQILIRTERLDLTGQIAALHAQAPALPHPALETAAREHAAHLAHLTNTTVLLRRQVLLVLREPFRTPAPADGLGGATPLAALTQRRSARTGGPIGDAAVRAAEARLARRLAEAADLLGPAGITITALDTAQATTVLASACNPDSLLPPSPELAAPDAVITTTAASDDDWPAEPAHHSEHAATAATEWDDAEQSDERDGSLIGRHGWGTGP